MPQVLLTEQERKGCRSKGGGKKTEEEQKGLWHNQGSFPRTKTKLQGKYIFPPGKSTLSCFFPLFLRFFCCCLFVYLSVYLFICFSFWSFCCLFLNFSLSWLFFKWSKDSTNVSTWQCSSNLGNLAKQVVGSKLLFWYKHFWENHL